MTSLRALIALVAVAVLLTGCTPPSDEPAPSPSITTAEGETPTPTPSPEAPQPSAVILSVDALTVVDATGAPLSSALFAEPDRMLELVTALEGGTAPTEDRGTYGTRYEWADGAVGVIFGRAWFDSSSATLGGLPLRTTQGIQVGSTRADVLALDPVDLGDDYDFDGLSDSLALEVRSEPGTTSLEDSIREGITFVEAYFPGDVVTRLEIGTDWFDI